MPAQITFGDPMESVDIVPRKSHIQQGASQQEIGYMRLGSEKKHANKQILFWFPDINQDVSPSKKA
jgi:hypothetical protein